jgi:micrococcal nuclease
LKSLIKFSARSVFTLVSLIALGYFTWIYVYPRLVEKESRESELHKVKRVIDGDTFELESGEKVRLLGIDTPEKYESKKLNSDAERSGQDKKTIQKLGELASDYAASLISNKRVKLLPEPNHEDKDRYGRLLRYVYLEDGTDFNKRMVEDGYAYAFRKYKISRLDEFIEAERRARLNKRGLWGRVDGLKQFE